MTLTKISLIAAVTVCCQLSFAAGPAFAQYSNAECNQLNWDNAQVHYKSLDDGSGYSAELAAALISYDVKDHDGRTVSSGMGTTVYINDGKLGSEEEYTICLYALINGEVVTQTITKNASPKKIAVKLATEAQKLESNFLQNCNVAYTATRPKFEDKNSTEEIAIQPTDTYINVVLANGGTDRDGSIQRINKNIEKTDYKAAESTISKIVKEKKATTVGFQAAIVFKGQVFTDLPKYFDITENAFSDAGTEVNK